MFFVFFLIYYTAVRMDWEEYFPENENTLVSQRTKHSIISSRIACVDRPVSLQDFLILCGPLGFSIEKRNTGNHRRPSFSIEKTGVRDAGFRKAQYRADSRSIWL